MRRLFIPACLCLATVGPTTIGPLTPWPIEPIATSTHAESKPKPKLKTEAKRRTTLSAGSAAATNAEPAASLAERLAPFAAALKMSPADQPRAAQIAAAARPNPLLADAYAAIAPSDEPANPLADNSATLALPRPTPVVTIPMSPPPGTPASVRKRVVYRSQRQVCNTLAKAAQSNNLPVAFFIRLLFQESKFDAASVSHAGAQGIAQFMPETARDVGLDNPFDPLQAIPAAARLLRDFIDQFGNLGLAAAAYNAGPTRVHKWLRRGGRLPAETRGYVKIITGQSAERWRAAKAGSGDTDLPQKAPCRAVLARYAVASAISRPLPPDPPRAVPKTPGNPGEVVASAEVDVRLGGTTAMQLAARPRSTKSRH